MLQCILYRLKGELAYSLLKTIRFYKSYNFVGLRFVTYRTACNKYYFSHCKSIVYQLTFIFCDTTNIP